MNSTEKTSFQSQSKMEVDLDSPQATLGMPLWGRAECTKLYPTFLTDKHAVMLKKKLIRYLNVNPRMFKEYLGNKLEYFILTFANRARIFDAKLQEYIHTHPDATVINLGAGLDTGFSRNDNGQIMWYDVDLPEVIKLRNQFLDPCPRNQFIAGSVLENEWIEQIQHHPEKGFFLVAGGLFMYFQPEEVQRIFTLFHHSFPGAELVFDAVSPLGLKIGNKRTASKSDKTGMFWYYAVSNPQAPVGGNCPFLTILDHFKYWERTPRNKTWSFRTKLLMKVSTWLKLAYFIHIRI